MTFRGSPARMYRGSGGTASASYRDVARQRAKESPAMTIRPWFPTIACAWLLALAGCGGGSTQVACANAAPLASALPAATTAAGDAGSRSAPTPESATAFVADVEQHLRTLWVARDRANWINENFVTDDTDALAAQGEEDTAAYLRQVIEQSKAFAPLAATLPPAVARKLYLLS